MTVGEYVVVACWNGIGYLEYLGIVTRDRSQNQIDALHHDGTGSADHKSRLKAQANAVEGEHFWREHTPEFDIGLPMLGQPVWVSYAREEENSKVVRGIILSNIGMNEDLSINMRVVFYSHRVKVRTCVPQSVAIPCDTFWSVTQPQPVYCDDD